MPEMPEVKRTTLYLPASLHRALKVQAAQDGTTLTDLVVAAVTEWLARQAPAEVRR